MLDLEVGNEVCIEPRGEYHYWRPATVVEKVALRSYCVRLKCGSVEKKQGATEKSETTKGKPGKGT